MDKENQIETFEEEYGFTYGDERFEMDDTPDHDDIVGWESDDWQDESEYDDYELSHYDEIYWEN